MKILVLSGGDSAEREVSLESGLCVAAALRSAGHHVDVIDPAVTPIASLKTGQWDIAFPVVHGTGGEDGKLQAELLEVGVPWVGSSPQASELTFDKIRTNSLLARHGIAVPQSVVVTPTQSEPEWRSAVASLETFSTDGQSAVVTKPPRQGSSIGISIVRDMIQLPEALNLAFQFDENCLVERFIAGREITVPVIDGTAFPIVEICPATEWFDYAAKYSDDRTVYVVSPPDLPASLPQTAVNACSHCGVTGIARVDFRLDGAGVAWLLEINTVPGMTSHSLVPKSAAAVGLSLGQLCEAAIETTLTHGR